MTPAQEAELFRRFDQPVNPAIVSTRPGPNGKKVQYIAGEVLFHEASRLVQGLTEWHTQVVETSEQRHVQRPDGKHTVIVRALVQVQIGTVRRQDVAVDQASSVPSANCPPLPDRPQKTNADLATAIANSTKSAVTLATVRALRTFGPALGLGLNDPVAMSRCTPACRPPPEAVAVKKSALQPQRHARIAPVPYPSPAKSPRTAPSVLSHPAAPVVSKKRRATPSPPPTGAQNAAAPKGAPAARVRARTLGTSPARSAFRPVGALRVPRSGSAVVASDFVTAGDLCVAAAAADRDDSDSDDFDSDDDEIFNQVDLDNL